jgi:diketogulonate reductase-like aldo/keto reductase
VFSPQGSTNKEHLQNNLETRDFALTSAEMEQLDAISDNGLRCQHFCWDPSAVL